MPAIPTADTSTRPAYVVLYRWRLHAGSETSFVEGWSRVSALLRSTRGSLGSRLHEGSDGVWYSYAVWPTAQARLDAVALGPVDPAAAKQMEQAISERLPEVELETVADFLTPSTHNGA